jgi:signal transduction histidine kinase/HAMP domain-containing protein
METPVSTSRAAERTATGTAKGISPAAVGMALGLITAAGASVVMAGWVAEVAVLVRSRPGPATLPFNGALSLAGLGLAVAALCWRPPAVRPRWLVRWATGAAAGAGALAAVALLEDITHRSLAIDRMFVRDAFTTVGHPGRAAPETSLAILLLSVALLAEAWQPGRARAVAWVSAAAAAVTVVAATELAGSSQQLFGLLGSSRVALSGVVFLGLIAVAIQAALSDRAGAVRALWVDPSVRASVLRIFVLPLPLIAVPPIVICTAIINRAHPGAGRIVSELGTAMLATLVFVNAWVGYRFAARMTRPLAAMAAGAGHVAEGDLQSALSAIAPSAAGAAALPDDRAGQDEIGQLSAAFDRMRADLESQARARWLINEARARASAEPDLAGAFGAFVNQLGAGIDFGRATYFRPKDTGDFVTEASAAPATKLLRAGGEVGESTPADGAPPARMIGPESIVIDDVEALPDDTGVRHWLNDPGMRSLLTVPTVAGGEVRALFTFSSDRPGVFGPQEAALLRSAVREAAVVFDMHVNLRRERAAVARLEEIDRQKNEFVNMVAHDLRSPMGIVAGFADTLRLRWDRLSERQREEFLRTISRNVNGLSGMVEDMLDVARIESGDFTYDISPFSLDALVRETTTAVVQSFGRRETIIAVDDGLPLAKGDEQRVWQVLTNLLSNACKFSEAGESVAVRVTAHGRMLRVAVSDRGPGVAPGDRRQIFDKYARLPAAPGQRQAKGTGLGLYICKLLVEAQGGQIGVQGGTGGGATFWFTVPAAPAEASSRSATSRSATPPLASRGASGETTVKR